MIRGYFSHIREHPEIAEEDLVLIRQHHAAARLCLDVGAGLGGFALAARHRGLTSMCLDVAPDLVPLWTEQGLLAVVGDVFSAPFRPNSFDVVRAKELIEHVRDPLALTRALGSLVAPDGILLLHAPSPWSQIYPIANFWDDYTHVRPWTKTGLRRVVGDAGLEVLGCESYTAGRNRFERWVGRILAEIVPHTHRIVARAARPSASRSVGRRAPGAVPIGGDGRSEEIPLVHS